MAILSLRKGTDNGHRCVINCLIISRNITEQRRQRRCFYKTSLIVKIYKTCFTRHFSNWMTRPVMSNASSNGNEWSGPNDALRTTMVTGKVYYAYLSSMLRLRIDHGNNTNQGKTKHWYYNSYIIQHRIVERLLVDKGIVNKCTHLSRSGFKWKTTSLLTLSLWTKNVSALRFKSLKYTRTKST